MECRLAVALLALGGVARGHDGSGQPTIKTPDRKKAVVDCRVYNSMRFGNCDPDTQQCKYWDRRVSFERDAQGNWLIIETSSTVACGNETWQCKTGGCMAGWKPEAKDVWCW